MKALLAVALLLSPALAAQQRLPSLGETIEVSIANVDVIVTDRNGNRVAGLTAGDFEIRQDGKPRRITNFAEYGQAASVPLADIVERPAEKAQAREPRTIAVF